MCMETTSIFLHWFNSTINPRWPMVQHIGAFPAHQEKTSKNCKTRILWLSYILPCSLPWYLIAASKVNKSARCLCPRSFIDLYLWSVSRMFIESRSASVTYRCYDVAARVLYSDRCLFHSLHTRPSIAHICLNETVPISVYGNCVPVRSTKARMGLTQDAQQTKSNWNAQRE